MKSTITITVAAVISLALAAYCGYAFCTDTATQGLELYAVIPVYIISLLLGAFVVELVHEGGHLIAGLCCRMGIKLPKIRLFRSSSVDLFPYGEKGMRARMIMTSSAGLLLTLLLIVVGVCALAIPQVSVILSVMLPYAVYSFIVNVAPLEYASGKTDGLIVWELVTGAPSAEVMLTVLEIQGLVHSGTQLADVPEAKFFEVPQLPEDDINFIILTQLRYEYYLAKGNDSEAYKYFARYKELLVYLPSEYGAIKYKGNKADGAEEKV